MRPRCPAPPAGRGDHRPLRTHRRGPLRRAGAQRPAAADRRRGTRRGPARGPRRRPRGRSSSSVNRGAHVHTARGRRRTPADGHRRALLDFDPVADRGARRPAWPVRSGVRFRSRERTVDGPGDRSAYNVRGFDAIVVLPEPGTDRALLDGADGLLAALTAVAPRVVLVDAPLDAATESAIATATAARTAAPRPLTGPSFGSYEPDDVTWLLQDLADVALEADTADRERAIQLEGATTPSRCPSSTCRPRVRTAVRGRPRPLGRPHRRGRRRRHRTRPA